MTSRYVSAGEGDIVYTIGPRYGDGSLFYSLSDIINRSVGASPLDRSIRGSVLDVIAEDLYLSLQFHSGNSSYPINNWFMTSDFHQNVNDFVIRNLDFLSGGTFYYRLEASYYPYEGTGLEKALYSEIVYTNAEGVSNDSVYVTEIIIAIPAASGNNLSAMRTFSNHLDNGLKGLLPERANASGYRVQEVVEDLDDVLEEISKNPTEVKRTGKVVIMIWPKAGGGNAARVL